VFLPIPTEVPRVSTSEAYILTARGSITAILIMVAAIGIPIEIGIGIDGKDGNSTPIPIAISISTGRMRSKLELLGSIPASGVSANASKIQTLLQFWPEFSLESLTISEHPATMTAVSSSRSTEY
jgi:hypothetical protein